MTFHTTCGRLLDNYQTTFGCLEIFDITSGPRFIRIKRFRCFKMNGTHGRLVRYFPHHAYDGGRMLCKFPGPPQRSVLETILPKYYIHIYIYMYISPCIPTTHACENDNLCCYVFLCYCLVQRAYFITRSWPRQQKNLPAISVPPRYRRHIENTTQWTNNPPTPGQHTCLSSGGTCIHGVFIMG